MAYEELDALKGAILLERQGGALYRAAAAAAASEDVGNLFSALADEEDRHQQWLERMFVEMSAEGSTSGFDEPAGSEVSHLLTPAVAASISGAGYEAAVISAAIGLEERAIDYYTRSAGASSDPGCRRVFTHLADWEKTHLELLTGLDRGIRERVWADGGFWPSI